MDILENRFRKLKITLVGSIYPDQRQDMSIPLRFIKFIYTVEEEFGKENQNGRIIIFDIKYEFHSEVGHNQKQ